MNLEDLKDQIKEEFSRIAGEIQDSSTYNTLREQFETLPSHIQKLIISGGAAIVVLIILSIPLSFLSSAGTYMSEFEEKRSLSQELIQVSSEVQNAPRMPEGLSASQMQTRLTSRLNQFNLVQEQMAGISPINAAQAGSLAPSGLQQEGVQVQLKKLNLKQMVDIGAMLQTTHPSIKMTGLSVQANPEDERYMDVVYRLVSYGPQPEPQEDAAGGGNQRPRRGRRSN